MEGGFSGLYCRADRHTHLELLQLSLTGGWGSLEALSSGWVLYSKNAVSVIRF
jgi:hypothetical protein